MNLNSRKPKIDSLRVYVYMSRGFDKVPLYTQSSAPTGTAGPAPKTHPD